MNEEFWDKFMVSGKISDYLEYKGVITDTLSVSGEQNGDYNSQRCGPEGISGR